MPGPFHLDGAETMSRTILWWGRFDPDYSRNRILRDILAQSGYRIEDFVPRSSLFGGLEAYFTNLGRPDCVWVPAFRHRDFGSARRFADKHAIPLIFDPLISSWDKVVFEREKFPQQHSRAVRLQNWERSLFSRADLVIADTEQHARFYIDQLGAPEPFTRVVPVGAEESIFKPCPASRPPADTPLEVLFYGSFIALQGPGVIVEAAARLGEANWTMLGDGPLRSACEREAQGLTNLRFEPWLDYERLGERICQADLLLGIFGTSSKAGRVIPNKVHQALSCGRPLVTRESAAYPAEIGNDMAAGISFVPPGDSEALAAAVQAILSGLDNLPEWGLRAHQSYQRYFSPERVSQALLDSLALIGL